MITLIKTIAQGTNKCTQISFEFPIFLFYQEKSNAISFFIVTVQKHEYKCSDGVNAIVCAYIGTAFLKSKSVKMKSSETLTGTCLREPFIIINTASNYSHGCNVPSSCRLQSMFDQCPELYCQFANFNFTATRQTDAHCLCFATEAEKPEWSDDVTTPIML